MTLNKDQIKKREEDRARLEAFIEKNKANQVEDQELQKDKETGEDKENTNREEEPFYVSAQKSKKKEKEEEEEEEFIIAICCGNECYIVGMNLAEAQDYCNKSNELKFSNEPEDRKIADQAWQLLSEGKESESRALVEKGIQAKHEREAGRQNLQSPSNTIKDPMQGFSFDLAKLKDAVKPKPSDDKETDLKNTPDSPTLR